MADIILSPFLQVLLDRLASPILQKAANLQSFNLNLKKLQSALAKAEAILEDVEDRQVRDQAVRIWLSDLKYAAHNVEDRLDRLAAEFSISERAERSFSAEFSCTIEKVMSADDIKGMLGELETLASQVPDAFLQEKISRSLFTAQYNRRETGSFVLDSDVYGRDEDKKEVIKLLLSKEKQVTCVALIGIGGLGKTTLAQLAYNDREVSRHFDIKMWVFVSDDFDVKGILKAAIESANKTKCDDGTMDVIQFKFLDVLQKKRYLLVLDDVWNGDRQEWDKLEPLLKGGMEGSKILLTTRNEKVASVLTSPTFPYRLKGLAENDCWMLFKDQAFPRGEGDKYPDLLSIGREIVKKCGGVPLVLKTLGSSMRLERNEEQWLYVQGSELWDLPERQSGILPALILSYHQLPPRLKLCFAFCSVFPRRFVFEKNKLIRMWMAAGLIPSKGEDNSTSREKIARTDIFGKEFKKPLRLSSTRHEFLAKSSSFRSAEFYKQPGTGEQYFQQLLWLSFFQAVGPRESDSDGIGQYRMHDVIHDLARFVSGKESIILDTVGSPIGTLKQARHVSLITDYRSYKLPEALLEAANMKTFLLFAGSVTNDFSAELLTNFPFLRVLDLNASGLTNVPDSIGNLRCLRHLNLSSTTIKILPEVIDRLPFLQTLDLRNCCYLSQLPHIPEMKSLLYLDVTGCPELTSMSYKHDALNRMQHGHQHIPFDLRPSSLRNHQLQRLPTFIVGGFLDLLFLKGLTHLQGDLNIRHLERVSNNDPWETLCLSVGLSLYSLGLYWGNEHEQDRLTLKKRDGHYSSELSEGLEPDAVVAEKFIAYLEPPTILRKLVVQGYPGRQFPKWDLTTLTKIYLSNFKNCESLPSLGTLWFLKVLSLQGMPAMQQIDSKFHGQASEGFMFFPALQELLLLDFCNLEKWSGTYKTSSFPMLRKLVVKKCPKLVEMPSFSTLTHLELRDCRACILNFVSGVSSLTFLAIDKMLDLSSLPDWFLSGNPLLTSLEIISCPMLASLPSDLGNLHKLKSFEVRLCENLSIFPQSLWNINALECLEIADCPSLSTLAEDGLGFLSPLKSLSIENCSNLASLPTSFRNLTCLERLTIMSCPSLVALPKDINNLSSLRSLTVLGCNQISSLPEELQYLEMLNCLEIGSPGLRALPEWIGNIASLRSLTIFDCPNIQQLPEGLKFLTGMQYLSIQECPKIEESCKETGEDWPKIAHIKTRRIGSPEVGHSSVASSSSA